MIYLDNSATTKQYDQVTDLMIKCMREDFGNPSSLYQIGLDAEKIIKNARKQVSDAMSVGTDGTVVFTSGGTEADNNAVFGSVKALKRKGNRIVTTAVEHPAILECCQMLEREGFDVVYVGVDKNCRLDEAQLESAINSDTILVTMMQVNNEAGTIMPVDLAREIITKKNAPAYLHSDCVQSFGKIELPKKADLISVSGHKIHGPKGSGALWIKKGINLPSYINGGGQESGRRSGTENVPAIAGLGLAAKMSADDRAKAMDKIAELRNYLKEGLCTIDDVVINSPETCGQSTGLCVPTLLNVTFKGTRGEVLLHTLETNGIYVSTGSACSSNKKGQSHVLKAMGLNDKAIEGTLRFSLSRFTTKEEIEEAVEQTEKAVKRFRRLGSFR